MPSLFEELLNSANKKNGAVNGGDMAGTASLAGALNTSSAGAPANNTNTATPNPSSAINLPGISDETRRALERLLGGYRPGQTVTDAQRRLQEMLARQPGAFSSQYTEQMRQLMDRINNRDAFSYDAASDPMFGQYRDQYSLLGNQAAQNTMGQAAALTGGYGNSYATTAANQANQQYMTQLTNVIPELRSQALGEYNNQGQALNDQYALANDGYSREYGQYQNDLSAWQTNRNFAQSEYESALGSDQSDYTNQLNYWYNLANQENENYVRQQEADRTQAYNTAMGLLKLGKMPSDEMLAKSGMSKADAKKFYDSYKRSSGGGSRSSSGSGSGSSGGGSSGGGTSPTTPPAGNSANADAIARKLYAQMRASGRAPDWSRYSPEVRRAYRELQTPTR